MQTYLHHTPTACFGQIVAWMKEKNKKNNKKIFL